MPASQAGPRPPLPLTVPSGFRIIAHRGASGYAPENTLAAFKLARKMGAKELEFDLQFSKDRQIVVCHDRALDRYGYPGLSVAELTLMELRDLDMGSWFSPFLYGGEKIPTLEDILSEFAEGFTLHAEIKEPSPGLGTAILDALDRHGAQDRTIVTSFDFDALAEIRALDPDRRVGWLVRTGGFNGDNVARAAEAGFHQLCPIASETTVQLVRQAHRSLPEIRAHSVKSADDIVQAVESGCDGMTINWPDWLTHAEAEAN